MNDAKMSSISKTSAIVLLAAVVLLSIYSVFHLELVKEASKIDYIKSGWVDSSGAGALLDTFSDVEVSESRFITLDSTYENEILFFSARNMFVDVLIDGECYLEDDKEQFFLFGKSPGTRWHTVSLPASDEPVTIELRGIACFDNSAGHIDNICVGNPENIYNTIVLKNLFIFIVNTIWQILGFALIVLYVVLGRKRKFGSDLLYLAIGTFFCAQWCNTETHILQLLIGHSEAIHLIEYLSLFAIPIPFGLLVTEQLEHKWIGQLYTLLAELNMLVVVALHISGVREFHYTTWTVYVLLILLLPMALKTMRAYASNEAVKAYGKYIVGSFIGTVIFIAIGMVRYRTGHYEDYAIYIRIALFLFLLVLIIYQLASLNTVIKKGMESELLHELALTDHLTKFYNRSGFAEHQSEYEKAVENKEHFGIIQFDVNNLKKVNDLQGHEKGDELICLASSGIYQSYGITGKCYRMGGDEFLVILRGDDPKADYEVGRKQLETYCYYANSVDDRSFDLNIAHGFTLVSDDDTLQSAIDRADELMYKNKKMMKEKAKEEV